MLYANSGHGARQTVTSAGVMDQSAVWLDLLDPTEDERSIAERASGLRVPARDDIAEIESSSRLYHEKGVLFLSTTAAFRGEDGVSRTAPLGFVLSEQRLLTIRFAPLPVFDAYAERFATDQATSSSEAFVGLLEAIVDRIADVLERVSTELDVVSKQTFRNGDAAKSSSRGTDRVLRAALVQIGRSGDSLGNLRDSLLGVGRMVSYVADTAADWMPAVLKPRLETVKHDIASLNDYDQQLTSKISFLLDAVLGFINIEQNNSVKLLTIVSVVGIPPTFVVGLYGMNFKNMPEYDWHYGYQYGWAMILLSMIIPLVWIRVKGWI